MRTITPLTNWLFCRQDIGLDNLKDASWIKVSLPHTWNGSIAPDDTADRDNACWYIRKLEDCPKEDLLFLEFNGAQSICDVYVNKILVGHHEGGFSAFRLDITEAVRSRAGAASVAVRVENLPSDSVYPQNGDFTLFGGLYRSVNLISVPQTHFNLNYYGAPGLYAESTVSGDDAALTIHAYIKNPKEGQLLHISVEGENAPDFETVLLSSVSTQVSLFGKITNAHRWNGINDPYLYRIVAVLSDESGELDRVEQSFGIREFSVDPEAGFFLNGNPYPLHGVCRHQDREDLGWAIGPTEQEEDVELILEAGATSVRLTNYQNDSCFYDLCDQKGLIVWTEIPFIRALLPNGQENETKQLMELILQNFNHPCILCWGLSSDLPADENTDEELLRRLGELKNLAASLDPSRLTAMALSSLTAPESPAARISDLRAAESSFIEPFHELFPSLPAAVFERGPEADLRWHSADPDGSDFTEEYQCLWHETAYARARSLPFLWADYSSYLFDYADSRHETGGCRGLHQNGLITYDRKTKKDAFFFYKACWSKESFVHLCGRRFKLRTGKTTEIRVYSNAPEVQLMVNGRTFSKQSGSHVFVFDNVPLRLLLPNTIAAITEDGIDVMRIFRRLKPYKKYICPQTSAKTDAPEIVSQPEV